MDDVVTHSVLAIVDHANANGTWACFRKLSHACKWAKSTSEATGVVHPGVGASSANIVGFVSVLGYA